jgi:catechol 2,3-dioxygenase-like lactoylglutathione lyase family enzyme
MVMAPHLRIARPVTDLSRTEPMYRAGLGLERIGHFEGHDGFDGVMLGEPGGSYHLEFTYCRAHPVEPTPTPEDLLVLYVPERSDWLRRCEAMVAAGFQSVASLNPYWDKQGRTFEDHDGYRIVVQSAVWTSRAEAASP